MLNTHICIFVLYLYPSISIYRYTHVFFHAIHRAGCWHSASQFQVGLWMPGTHPRADCLMFPSPCWFPPYLALGVQASSEEVPRWAGLLQQPLQQPQAQPPIAAGQQDTAHAEPLHPHCSPQPVVLPKVWQSASIIWEVATLWVLLGWVELGGPPAPPLLEGTGQQDVLLHPRDTHHLDDGVVALLHSPKHPPPSISQNTHPPQTMGTPNG